MKVRDLKWPMYLAQIVRETASSNCHNLNKDDSNCHNLNKDDASGGKHHLVASGTDIRSWGIRSVAKLFLRTLQVDETSLIGNGFGLGSLDGAQRLDSVSFSLTLRHLHRRRLLSVDSHLPLQAQSKNTNRVRGFKPAS